MGNVTYAPSQNLFQIMTRHNGQELMPWDEYFPTMAEADFLCGHDQIIAVKTHHFRTPPFGGSTLLMGGITSALQVIDSMRLDDPELAYGLRDLGYSQEFIDLLAIRQKMMVRVYAPYEGQVIFPNEPAVSVVGTLPDIRTVEGILTAELNYPTLSMTKWHRLVRAVRPGQVLDFSRRRSQDPWRTTVYAMLAGCTSTSNSQTRPLCDFKITGTMGHEWPQKYGDVRQAFRDWLKVKPNKAIGLIDTKQCLEHDFPIWLDVVEEFKEEIKKANPIIWGWRNDSGDLAYLTIEQYIRFWRHPISQDPWFAERMRIVLTNNLDEYSSQDIIQQIRTQASEAGLDAEDILRRIIWAAGTKPGTCADQPSIDGVSKLMEAFGFACIKLALDADGKPGAKTSIPGFNQSALIRDRNGEVKFVWIFPSRRYQILPNGKVRDVPQGSELYSLLGCHPDAPSERVEIHDYHATIQEHLLYDSLNGDGFTAEWDNPTIKSVVERVQTGMDQLPWTMTRLRMPTKMPVYLSPDLFLLRSRMIKEGVLREDFLERR